MRVLFLNPSPTIHRSFEDGGLNSEGRGPEKPPPTATITKLTTIPNVPKTKVSRITRRMGDIISFQIRLFLKLKNQKKTVGTEL